MGKLILIVGLGFAGVLGLFIWQAFKEIDRIDFVVGGLSGEVEGLEGEIGCIK